MIGGRPARVDIVAGPGLVDQLADDVASLAQQVDAPPLEAALLRGYMDTRPEFFGEPTPGVPGLGVADLAADLLAVATAMLVAAQAQAVLHGGGAAAATWSSFLRLLPCLPVVLLLLAPSRHRLRLRLDTTLAREAHEAALPVAGATLVCITALRMLRGLTGGVRPPEDALLVTCFVAMALVAAVRTVRHVPARRDGVRARRVLVVGSGVVADRLTARLDAGSRVSVLGFVDDDPGHRQGWLGDLGELAEVCERMSVDHVVVAFTRAPAEQLVEALRGVQGRLPISVVPRLFDVLPATAAAQDLASGYPAMSVAPASLGWWPDALKRAMDVAGALVGLVVCLPVLLAAAIGVRLSSPGPVLLRQARVGQNGQEFTVWKFRTFTVTESVPPAEVLEAGEQVMGPFPKLKQDPRSTRFGRLLRRLSIDELPQLVNVLTGTMALVGPRPLQPEFAWRFGSWALRRYAVKPGLTGLWQVSGRNDLTYEEMCRLDHLYVTSWSVGLDLRILARTARAVLGGRGCY